MPPYSLTEPAVLAFVALPLALVLLFGWGTYSAWRASGATPARAKRAAILLFLAADVWLATTWVAARRGVFLNFDATPPPFAFLVVGVLVLSIAIAFSPLGGKLARHLPLWSLIAFQAFRLPLELAMHRLVSLGIMPDVMSYSGRNFDILTGALAIPVAILVARRPRAKLLAVTWNSMGLVLLINIVVVAILATPRFKYFGSDQINVFVTQIPFVWLPAVLVLAALAGHLVIWRALNQRLPANRLDAHRLGRAGGATRH